ncbi:MAG: hypothetical protein VX938_14000 [Myxococcota bacterium]|nr:hypothetical protein [Myxococcota bacterium]
MSSPSLELNVLPPGSSIPDSGSPLTTLGTSRGVLESVDGGLRATVSLHEGARTEQRWVFDQLCRKVTGALDSGEVRFRPGEGLDKNTALTLALDRRLAHGEDFVWEGPSSLAGQLQRIGGGIDVYKGWVDEDPAIRTSIRIAEDVSAWGETQDQVEVDVYEENRLAELGMNLLLAVGGASPSSPPRLVMARYKPDDPRPPRMLLGKGITFDTGGINVKPYESFVSMMKNDMGGAALAWSLFKTLVEMGVDEPLLLVLPTCENAVGENAMRPGSLVKSYRGHTVRIDHTDAEGRLVLADGLAYASDLHRPGQVICFATLTTAALIAYGPYATPVHFANPDLRDRLIQASERMGEDLHFMPGRIWHLEANRDEEGDLKNTARLPGHANRSAGSRNAAHFLRHFTDAPLVHLDIFASTWNWAGDAPGVRHGATGAPLRTLIAALGDS